MNIDVTRIDLGYLFKTLPYPTLLITRPNITYTLSCNVDVFIIYILYWLSQYVLIRVSFGSKDCTKELKQECAYFLGQTS